MRRNLLIRAKYEDFKELLRADASALDLIADLEAHLYGHDPADAARVRWLASELIRTVERMADSLGRMNADHADVAAVVARISTDIAARLVPQRDQLTRLIISLDQAAAHPAWVGGKAANLSRASGRRRAHASLDS